MIEPLHDSGLARVKPGGSSMRHPAGVMVCPRCETPLQACDHKQGIAWRCGKCGGQSLNFSQFRRMVPEDGANAIWENAMSWPDPPHRRTPCPECHNGMDAVYIPLNEHRIELDICQPCQRLWLDRLEGGGPIALSLTFRPARRRPWFAARGAPRPDRSENPRDIAGDRLFSRSDETRRGRWVLGSLARGVILGIVVYLVSWPLPASIRIRLAEIVAIGYFALKVLRR